MAAQPTDPYSAAFGAAAKLGTAALDDKTNQTSSSTFNLGFDNSGWAVNVGTGQQNASADKATGITAGFAQALKNPAVLAVVALLAYVYLKRGK